MIEELTSYFSEGYYQEKDEKIVKALEDYETGRGLPGEEGTQLRETARAELEEQLVASGQAEADTVFINPEEFFPEGMRDQERIDNFRKDMTKKLANQQMLWSFAGTTGSMTVITEKHLESLGRDLDSLKPAALRRETGKNAPKASPGAVPLYLYGDGTAGQTYDRSKAKLSFDKCRDKSGFDWKQMKYDPNYSVEKSGWFGGVNKEGVWEAVETTAVASGSAVPGQAGPKREIELINTLNGALIFDAALLLCGPEEEEYYYSLDGELYGAVKTDRAGTVERLKEALGGLAPVGIVLPAGVDEGIRGAYGKLLEELGITNNTNGKKEGVELANYTDFSKGANGISRVYVETDEAWQNLLVEDKKERETLEQATLALGAAARLRRSGLDEEVIGAFLESEEAGIDVPLNPFVKEDRTVLLEESLAVLEPDEKKAVQESVESWFEGKSGEIGSDEMVHILPVVTAALPLLATAIENGLGAEAVLEEAYNRGLKADSPATKVKLNGRVSLEELSRGMTPFGTSAAASESPDFFNGEARTQAAQIAGLKDGEIASLAESVDKLNMPPMDRKEFNKRLSAALASYRTVQMSTGMTVSDLVSTVDSITMKRPDAKRLGSKEIYFEESLGDLLAAGAVKEIPTKTVHREELFIPLLADVPDFDSVKEETTATAGSEVTETAVNGEAATVTPILDHSTARSLTESLLAALIAAPSPEAQPLSSRQLSGLKELYTTAGAPADVASEAVKQWEAARFTPEEYKAVRESLKKKLREKSTRIPEGMAAQKKQMPASTVSVSAEETQVLINPLELTDSLLTALMMNPSPEAQPLRQAEIADLDRVYRNAGVKQDEIRTALKQWEQVRFTPEDFTATRSALKKKLETAEASGIESPVAAMKTEAGRVGAVLATSQFTAEEQKTVQAVMEAYRVEESASVEGMKHPMTNEMLMPLVSRALAGQWGGVPAGVRPMMNRAVGRSSGVSIPSFKSPSATILEDARKQMASTMTHKGTSLRPVTRQIPQTRTPAISGKSGYNRVGYRVNPSTGQSFPLHKQSVGSRLEGLGSDFVSYTSPKLDIVRGVTQDTPRLSAFELEKPVIQAVAAYNFATISHIKDFPHPFMNGGGASPGFDISRGAAGFPGGMSRPRMSPNPQVMTGFTQEQNSHPLSRLDRINANYEQDKAGLGQGEQRMLARSESKGVGHANGTGSTEKTGSVRSLSSDLLQEMREQFDQPEV